MLTVLIIILFSSVQHIKSLENEKLLYLNAGDKLWWGILSNKKNKQQQQKMEIMADNSDQIRLEWVNKCWNRFSIIELDLLFLDIFNRHDSTHAYMSFENIDIHWVIRVKIWRINVRIMYALCIFHYDRRNGKCLMSKLPLKKKITWPSPEVFITLIKITSKINLKWTNTRMQHGLPFIFKYLFTK